MKDYLRFAGRDEVLEAEWPSHSILSRVVLPHRMLSDGEAQKVKTGSPILRVQSVAYSCLARFQFQSHAFEPLFDDALTLVNDSEISVTDDEVVCVPNNRWNPFDHLAIDRLGFGKGIPDDLFQAMQSHICQQGGQNPTLRCALLGWGKNVGV
jgi:hypothetical protein